MTMTTEKLAELKRKAEKTTNGFMLMIWPEEFNEVIALAERALQPEEGQAHCLACAGHGASLDGSRDCAKCGGSGSTDATMSMNCEECDGTGASQLALPAGPVPEGAIYQRRVGKLSPYHWVDVTKADYDGDHLFQRRDYRIVYASPAVAQPVAEELDTERLDFIETNPNLRLTYHKKRWALIGMTGYEYEVFKTAREAIDATRVALCQPVADEREAFEHNLRVGYQNHNLKRQERGLASSDQLTTEQEREIAKHVELAFPSHTQGTSKSMRVSRKDTPIAFSCAKRAAHPTSWSMTCDKHCGDDAKCIRAALGQPAEEGGKS